MIRPATAEDRAAIEALVERAYVGYVPRVGRRPAPMDDDYGVLIAKGAVSVDERDGRIAGVLVLQAQPAWLLVDNVAVEPELRGRGIGRALLDHAEERARALGLPELRLYTHVTMTENQAIYRHLGWEEYDRRDEGAFSRVFFRRTLASGPCPSR
jgi:ribosomal protein S18 acetylase RimI-like enzyme